jgi:hypothetical protein
LLSQQGAQPLRRDGKLLHRTGNANCIINRRRDRGADRVYSLSLLKTPKAKKSWSFSGIQSFE